ncbi:MAG TPA: RsmD family RNA methyltransferase [Dehalococcoidia bacterium]
MRVIAGEARGRILHGPKSAGTRPTSDLARGAVFSMLESRGASFTRVLDLFAGTGALGIEALSRGADWADFIESDRAACGVIAANLVSTGFQQRAAVVCAALPVALRRVWGSYGLIFVDPPYGLDNLSAVWDRLRESGTIDPETTIAYEHSRRTIPPERCGPLPRIVTRAHGTTAVSLYYAGAPDTRDR